ncbi:hypothetical protein MML48_1g02163 [Holotrichia oblita]|uniref:Uncharacterized protein n=1 Tax=Holotrichia oblita TaxID=644536 RepID=A0ACB9TVU5_HOLOL|nr:hypothetical protein MML48_1g02163 [Holotrichia oblita]
MKSLFHKCCFVSTLGTKWCGGGNISENHDDLGQFADTDRCCRDHDYCDDVISGHETKYNLTNSAFYSRLNCLCDAEFRHCLRNVNSAVSSKVGFIYFNVLGTQCFREDYPAMCKRTSFVPIMKCVEYEYNELQEKVYQWFDVPSY